MLSGDIRNQFERIWDAFWSDGISNPLEVIEQITCLMFIRRENNGVRSQQLTKGNCWAMFDIDRMSTTR